MVTHGSTVSYLDPLQYIVVHNEVQVDLAICLYEPKKRKSNDAVTQLSKFNNRWCCSMQCEYHHHDDDNAPIT